jgi:hypothetical protein
VQLSDRFKLAGVAAVVHFVCSVMLAAVVAMAIFGVWYPYPYQDLSGGRELFLLVVVVDVVCGPLLTFVAFVQTAALGYGVYSVWEARPLYLVQEIDRFKVIGKPDLEGLAAQSELKQLTPSLRHRFWMGPQTVGIREPKNADEQAKVLFESVNKGRDFAERPNFYLPYEGVVALKSLLRAKPLSVFLQKHPDQQEAAKNQALGKRLDLSKLLYLPVVARQDWVAVLDDKGMIVGFLKGNGF